MGEHERAGRDAGAPRAAAKNNVKMHAERPAPTPQRQAHALLPQSRGETGAPGGKGLATARRNVAGPRPVRSPPVRCFALTVPGPNARISPVNTAQIPTTPRDRQYPVVPTFFDSLKC